MKVGVAYDACIGRLDEHFKDFHVINLEKDDLHTYDLVIFTGGEDINPNMYGEKVVSAVGVNDARDKIESQVWNHFTNGEFNPRTKVLGICRGFQFLYVKYGGRLYQDLESVKFAHPMFHELKWMVNSPLSSYSRVNSLHHQGGKATMSTGMELLTLAIEPKTGIPEVILSTTGRMLAVQFHPEFFNLEFGKPFFDVVKNWWGDKNFKMYAVREEESKSVDFTSFSTNSFQWNDSPGHDITYEVETELQDNVTQAEMEARLAELRRKVRASNLAKKKAKFAPATPMHPVAQAQTFTTPTNTETGEQED